MVESQSGKAVKAEWLWRGIAFGLLSVVTYLAADVYSGMKRSGESSIRQEERLTNLTEKQIPELVGRLNDRVNAHAQRLDTIDRRNDNQDTKIEIMSERIWRSLPGNVRGTP